MEYMGVELARRYLKNYRKYKAAVLNLEEDIAAFRAELAGIAAAVARYGAESGGRGGACSSVERMAAGRMEVETRIGQAVKAKSELEHILRRLDRALASLSEEERALVAGHFIEGKTWRELGEETYQSEKWVCIKGNRALQAVASMLFGIRAIQEQIRLDLQ